MKDLEISKSPAQHRKNTDFISFEGRIKRIGKEDFKIHKVVGKGSYGKVYLVEKMAKEGTKGLLG